MVKCIVVKCIVNGNAKKAWFSNRFPKFHLLTKSILFSLAHEWLKDVWFVCPPGVSIVSILDFQSVLHNHKAHFMYMHYSCFMIPHLTCRGAAVDTAQLYSRRKTPMWKEYVRIHTIHKTVDKNYSTRITYYFLQDSDVLIQWTLCPLN